MRTCFSKVPKVALADPSGSTSILPIATLVLWLASYMIMICNYVPLTYHEAPLGS